jgi:hypothetical protein
VAAELGEKEAMAVAEGEKEAATGALGLGWSSIAGGR